MNGLRFPPIAPRFSGKPDAKKRYFHDLKEKTDERIVNLPANADKPETDLSRARQAIRRGAYAAAAGVIGLGSLAGGAAVGKSVLADMPSGTERAQHAALAPDWETLAQASVTADELGGNINDRLITGVQNFMIRQAMTLAQYPNQDLNASLLETIRQEVASNPDFMPAAAADAISIDLMNYLDSLDLPADPSERELNGLLSDIEADFIRNTPALSGLDFGQTAQLVDDIKQVILETSPEPLYADYFDPVFVRYLGNGIAGLELDDLKDLRTEEDAIRLFSAIAQNPDNFPHLNDAERDAYVKYGVEILENLELDGPSPLYATLSLILLGGGLGLAGYSVLRRKDILGLPSAKQDLDKLAETPVLFVTNADQVNPENKRRVRWLKNGIFETADRMETVMRRVLENHMDAKAFVTGLYAGKGSLPTAEDFRMMFDYQAYGDIVKNMAKPDRIKEKPVTELAFLENVYRELDIALETGQLLPMAIVDQASEATAENGGNEKTLYAARQKTDRLITETRLLYANALFGVEHARMTLDGATQTEAEAKENFKTVGQAMGGEAPEAQAAYRRWEAAKEALVRAKDKLGDAEELLSFAKENRDAHLPALTGYRNRVQSAIETNRNNASIEELQKIRNASGELVNDPALEEALREEKIQETIRRMEAQRESAQASVRARMESSLKAIQQEQSS